MFAVHDEHAVEPAALYVMGAQGTADERSISPVALHAVPAGQAICTDGDEQYEPSAHTVALALPIGQYVPMAHAYCVGVDEPATQ